MSMSMLLLLLRCLDVVVARWSTIAGRGRLTDFRACASFSSLPWAAEAEFWVREGGPVVRESQAGVASRGESTMEVKDDVRS